MAGGRTGLFLLCAAGVATGGCGPDEALCIGDEDWVYELAPLMDTASTPLRRGHVHNDYLQAKPLENALSLGFTSVEVDLIFVDSVLQIAHEENEIVGSLASMYLDPLVARVEERGSVHGDGATFYLWLDIKVESPGMAEAIAAIANRAAFTSTTARPAITLVMSGDLDVAEDVLRTAPHVMRDSQAFTIGEALDGDSAQFYSLKWNNYIDWSGAGTIEQAQKQRLACIVSNAHREKRAVRFYASPDTEDYWRLALDSGVDFINTDRADELARFLELTSPR